MALDNLRGGTKRVVEEESPLNNLRGGTKRVVIVDGGGGKSVPQYATMPTADASNVDNIVQYKGETDATYTNGYFYKNVGTTTASSATATQTVGATLSDIAVDVDTLESFTGWITDNSLQIFYTADGWSVDTTSLGVTYTGTPNVGDAITITYTAESTSYAWTQIDVQPAPEALPDQTGQSGKFLTTDGTDASWSDKPLVNTATQTTSVDIVGSGGSKNYNRTTVLGKDAFVYGDETVAIGYNASSNPNGVSVGRGATCGANSVSVGKFSGVGVGKGCVSIGHSAGVEGYKNYGIAIGNRVHAAANGAIQLGSSQTDSGSITVINSDANTFKVANANGNYEIMSADGTVPTDRLTKVNTTATLAVADWSSSTQTVTVSGVTATSVVFVSPAPASASDYASAGILCTAQAANSLTFTCTTTPTNAITVNVVCM